MSRPRTNLSTHAHFLLALFVIFALVAGCGSQADDPPNEVPSTGENEGPVELPRVSSQANCTEFTELVDPCTWANSTDAVVYGRIETIAPLDTAFVDLDGALVSQCSETASYGLVISLAGVVSNDPGLGDTITFRVGSEITGHWSVPPFKDDNGQLAWAGNAELVTGQYIGAALHQLSDGTWFLGPEQLFAGSAGQASVTFQSERESIWCMDVVPDLAGTSISSPRDLIDHVKTCGPQPSSDALARRGEVDGLFINTQQVNRTFASECATLQAP